ncbi:MAG: hypothetical protein WEC39_00865 [Patescibacteria group bacterium]
MVKHTGKVELIGLKCTSCGSPSLGNFVNGTSKCQNCGTIHVLLGSGKKIPKNIFTSNGIVVEIPPSIAIGELLRVNQISAETGGIYFDQEDRQLVNEYPNDPEDADEVSAEDLPQLFESESLKDLEDNDFLAIGFLERDHQIETTEEHSGFLGRNRKTVKEEYDINSLYFPFEMDFRKLPYNLRVYGRKHLGRALEIAQLIQEKLGYPIKIGLKRS